MVNLVKMDKWTVGRCFDHPVLPKKTLPKRTSAKAVKGRLSITAQPFIARLISGCRLSWRSWRDLMYYLVPDWISPLAYRPQSLSQLRLKRL